MTFLDSILNNSKEHNDPFKHWEYNDALTDGAIEEIAIDYAFALKISKKI